MLTASGEELAALFGLGSVSAVIARYNISPNQFAPMVVHDGEKSRILRQGRWGQTGAAPPGSRASFLINARAETAALKRSFRGALARRRCLVPASGFFEWRRAAENASRIPHLFSQADGSPFAIAGLFYEPEPPSPQSPGTRPDSDRPAAAQLRLFEEPREQPPPQPSFVLLTTKARGPVSEIHERMPLVLAPAHFASWIDPATERESILERLATPPDVELVSRVVSRRVNSVANDDEECIRELPRLDPD